MEPTRVVFLVYPNVTQLDLTGPAQVLSRLPQCQASTSCGRRAIRCRPTAASPCFRPPRSTRSDKADILCVPGGFGCVDVMQDDEVLDWVRGVGEQAQWVTSVCTGSLILGAAGLLQRLSRDVALGLARLSEAVRCGAGRGARRVRPQSRDRRRSDRGHRLRARADGARFEGEDLCPRGAIGSRIRPASAVRFGHARKRRAKQLVQCVHERSNRMAPDREERIRAAAERFAAR